MLLVAPVVFHPFLGRPVLLLLGFDLLQRVFQERPDFGYEGQLSDQLLFGWVAYQFCVRAGTTTVDTFGGCKYIRIALYLILSGETFITDTVRLLKHKQAPLQPLSLLFQGRDLFHLGHDGPFESRLPLVDGSRPAAQQIGAATLTLVAVRERPIHGHLGLILAL